MRRAPSAAQLQRQVAEWNAQHPVGTRVRYWRGERKGEPSGEGITHSPATVLGGHTAVAWIEGCSGCVALSHVEAVQHGGAS